MDWFRDGSTGSICHITPAKGQGLPAGSRTKKGHLVLLALTVGNCVQARLAGRN
jgi:hypothetical protein